MFNKLSEVFHIKLLLFCIVELDLIYKQNN